MDFLNLDFGTKISQRGTRFLLNHGNVNCSFWVKTRFLFPYQSSHNPELPTEEFPIAWLFSWLFLTCVYY